jgi:hypothetical protein
LIELDKINFKNKSTIEVLAIAPSMMKILDAKYEKVDLDINLKSVNHLGIKKKVILEFLSNKYKHLFDNLLGD